MELETKANILVEFIQSYKDDEDYEEFFDYNDLGLPLAICYVSDMVELKPEGIQTIEETYSELCEIFDADDTEEYENLDELIG